LAIDDPVKEMAVQLFHVQRNVISLMFGFFLLASMIKDKKTQIIIFALSFIFPVCIHAFQVNVWSSTYINLVIQIIVAAIIVTRIAAYLEKSHSINVFLCILLAYISVPVFKRIALIVNPDIGAISLWLGGIIQILFGIAFVFININTASFRIIKERADWM
jgi:hypothetical protein